MQARFKLDTSEFNNAVRGTIRGIGNASKHVTNEACEKIYLESQGLVPTDTGALRDSGYYEVRKRSDILSYRYEGEIGYSDEVHDRLNPKSNSFSSSYAMYVHENLFAYHPNGQAKFLEIPFLRYTTSVLPEELRQKYSEVLKRV
jgi:hypothetical protein